MSFTHFEPALCQFFRELANNNNRAWFHEHKPRFDTDVMEPLLNFVAHMSHELPKLSKQFEAIPKKQGGSLFRIYKDVRFARDKRPYREHAACRFSHRSIHGMHSPCFYFQINAERIVLGAGIWQPHPDHLFTIRDSIREKPESWQRVRAQLFSAKTPFDTIHGEQLKRAPRSFSEQTPYIDDIKLKSFFVTSEYPADIAMQDGFMKHVSTDFRAAMPLLTFICQSLSLSI